jgi:cytochrome P450
MVDTAAPAPPGALAPRPAHVPDALVYDFDHFEDPALLADPHGRAYELVSTLPPIFWTPRHGGSWVAIGHDANFEIGRDWETLSSELIPQSFIQAALAQMPPGTPRMPQPIPINVDPPMHGKFRIPLNGPFSPKAMTALKGEIRTLAAQLLDEQAPKGRCEFMTAVAEPLPVQVFLKMMGLPLERQALYRDLVKDQLAKIASTPEEGALSMMAIAAAMRDTILERRDAPQDDLISLLWRTEIDGQPMTLDVMEDYAVLLFIAGLDTVMNGMGFGVRHLALDQALQARLRANPEEIADATEELLRRYTFTVPSRRVAHDVVFRGVEMKAGDRLIQFLPSADLDPARFASPDRFDMAREDKVHIAFNSGPHRCLGSHLARVELQVLYEELLKRIPTFRLDPERPPTFHGGHVIGVDALDLVWDA